MIIVTMIFKDADTAQSYLDLAADDAVALSKTHVDPLAVAECTPREIPATRFYADEKHTPFQHRTLTKALLECLRRKGRATRGEAEQVAEDLGFAPKSASSYLSRMVDEGLVERVARGVYAEAEKSR